MREEPKGETPPGQYTGRVLPGSRWRQRGFSGHPDQDVTVLRVGARSVMLVIEGGAGGTGLAGRDRRKVGQKFNVVLETFLKTHTLISQPKGYKPGDEVVAPPTPKVDAVETYFKRRQFAQNWLASMEGRDIRVAATDPDFPILVGPQRYTGDVVVPTPQEEEPVQSAQAEPEQPQQEQPFEDIVPEEVLAQTAEEPAPEPEPEPEPVINADPPVLPVDPLDALVDNARAIVTGLDTEIAAKQWDRDELAEKVAKLDAEIATLSTRRTRATHAVDALVATLLGINEPEPPAPEPLPGYFQEGFRDGPPPAPPVPAEVQHEASEVVARPSANGTVRLATREGYVPRPGKLSQRQWVLDRLVREGKLVIQEVVDDFAAEYDISRDAAIKNISSVMHHQIKHPNDQWPVPVRAYPGSYVLPEPAQPQI